MKKIIAWIRSEKGTIVRSGLQALAYINQFIAIIGQSSFANAAWYQWVSLIVTFLITALNWWENNDFTAFAKLAGKVLDALEDGKITEDEVKKILKGNKKKKEEPKE